MPNDLPGGKKPGAKTRTVARKAKRSILSPVSLADLARSGISEQDALDNDMSSAAKAKLVEGFEDCGLPGPVTTYPYRDLHGKPKLDVSASGTEVQYTRLRLHEENTVGKYIQPKNSKPHVYYSEGPDWAAIAKDTGEDTLILEGEKKSVAACLEGYAAIGVGGVDAFLYNGELIDDVKEWSWKGRHTYIVFDSDIMTKERVLKAEERLAFELALLGAIIHRVRLPTGPITPDHPTGEKWGIDDFFEIIRQDGEDPGEVMDALLDETPPEVPDEVLEAPFDWLEEVEKDVEPLKWIVPHRICLNQIQRCDGEPEVGKSFLWLQIAIHLALGVPLFGIDVIQTPVMIIFAEDDRSIIIPRIRGILVSLGYGKIDNFGNFVLYRNKLPERVLPLKFWCAETDNLELGSVAQTTLEVKKFPLYKKMVMFAQRFDGPPLIICDTIRDTIRFNENDADAANVALKQIYGQLKRDLGAGVVGLGHPSKTSMQDDRIRTAGGVTNKGAVKVVSELRLAERQGFPDDGMKFVDWLVTKSTADPIKPTTNLMLANDVFQLAPEPDPVDLKYIQDVIRTVMMRFTDNGTRMVRGTGNGIRSGEVAGAIELLCGEKIDTSTIEANIRDMEILGIIKWSPTEKGIPASFVKGPNWNRDESEERMLLKTFVAEGG